MAAGRETAPELDLLDSDYSDEAGRPIGEYQPSALERLKHLHSEAVETLRLMKLLARVPTAAIALGTGGAILIVSSANSVPAILLGAWALFVGAAVTAMLRLARRAGALPINLLSLRTFSLDLNAVMLFAGFSWGAGAFIGMPASATMGSLLVFTLCGALAMGMILRAKGASLYFLVPNIALAAAAALFGSAGLTAASMIFLLGGVVAAALELFDRIVARRAHATTLPSLIVS